MITLHLMKSLEFRIAGDQPNCHPRLHSPFFFQIWKKLKNLASFREHIRGHMPKIRGGPTQLQGQQVYKYLLTIFYILQYPVCLFCRLSNLLISVNLHIFRFQLYSCSRSCSDRQESKKCYIYLLYQLMPKARGTFLGHSLI